MHEIHVAYAVKERNQFAYIYIYIERERERVSEKEDITY